nr:unnamed protein product [Digitaria exilis]
MRRPPRSLSPPQPTAAASRLRPAPHPRPNSARHPQSRSAYPRSPGGRSGRLRRRRQPHSTLPSTPDRLDSSAAGDGRSLPLGARPGLGCLLHRRRRRVAPRPSALRRSSPRASRGPIGRHPPLTCAASIFFHRPPSTSRGTGHRLPTLCTLEAAASRLLRPLEQLEQEDGAICLGMSAMAPHYQAATLIASPSYPNAIAWSSDNLVAVASGHIVTILNPAAIDGPRGLVGLRRSDPFPIGVVNREDLFEPCLVPTSLARDTEPCARSISWSQQGFAPNSGCLLAVCTVDGRVKLYRSPIWEFCDEWVEVADISQSLFNYYKIINFGEDNLPSLNNTNTEEIEVLGSTCELQDPSLRGSGQRKRKPPRFDGYVYDGNQDDVDASEDADFSLKPCSKSKKKSLKKVTTGLSAPVSSISLAVPARYQYAVNLAIGRVSGSLETWIWNTSSCKIDNTNTCHAHDQVLSEVSNRCFGLTLAPGQQMVAVVRSLDLNLLDQMYQVRINSACEYAVEETCPYCSAPVHFESTDTAICRERHTLSRCRASMLLCSVLHPVWHCVCCGGMVDKLLPESFFAMQASPLDANQDEGSLDLSGAAVPLCPFCGILLQRSVPAFLLSTSPV